MSLRVLIVPDKFKGTLTARAAAQAIARGWQRARPKDRLQLLPMSDGGDGFGEVMRHLLHAVPQKIKTCDAAHRSCVSQWWWDPRTRTAIIETARVIGLAMLPAHRYHPFQLDTFGLGKIIDSVLRKQPKRILVGLGGSATNDGGFGMARALGWKFKTRKGELIEDWTKLDSVRVILPPANDRKFPEFILAVDVQNRLLGKYGATRTYGPQKGLRPQDFLLAERCLGQLGRLVRRLQSVDHSVSPGAGSAGGLGFGFAAFLDGRFEPGFGLFANEVGLSRRLRSVDLVLTGEGAMDRSTFMGKGAGQVARHAQTLGVPCIVFAGMIDSRSPSHGIFTRTHALTELTSLRQAKARPAVYLTKLAYCAALNWEVPSSTGARPHSKSKSRTKGPRA